MARIIRPDFNRRRSPRKGDGRIGGSKRKSTVGIPMVTVWCFIALAFLTIVYLNPTGQPSEAVRQGTAPQADIYVVDGDTVRSRGQIFRLVGFNTPEAGSYANCAHERELAAEATKRLRELLNSGDSRLQKVDCACAPGTEGTRRCNHGRLCARLFVNGRDVARTMIAQGLAEHYECGGTSCPKRRDWCKRS